jgi:hypothetical protein
MVRCQVSVELVWRREGHKVERLKEKPRSGSDGSGAAWRGKLILYRVGMNFQRGGVEVGADPR